MSRTITGEVLVESWMSSPVRAVDRKSTVREVLEIMKDERVSSVPVVDADGHVIGIVTLGDLARVVLSTDQLLDSDYPHYEDCFWAVYLGRGMRPADLEDKVAMFRGSDIHILPVMRSYKDLGYIVTLRVEG